MTQSSEDKTVGLLLIGGLHQIFHLIPVAAGLQEEAGIKTIIFVTTAAEKEACVTMLRGLGVVSPDAQILTAHPLLKRITPKLAYLLSNLKIWTGLDALIVAERTSTILRYVTIKMPVFIHIPHGAGDRAKSYDPRIRHFDHVLVAGPKDKNRMIDLGLVSLENCHVTGYIKPFAVTELHPEAPIIFENMRPVVLYNPHFSAALSSWPAFGFELLEAFSQRPDYNLIFAPHMRLFSKATDACREEIEAFAAFDNIHIDLGSVRSTDMSYTRAANIYLGDVSSQVYEFLSDPKPCIFLGDKATQWQDNPDYAHWSFGPVCHSVTDVMRALTTAEKQLPDYSQAQRTGCLAAKGNPDWNPIARAAKVVASILRG